MSELIPIRPIQLEDIDACAKIVASTPLWQRYGMTYELAAARLTSGLQSGAHILVATTEIGHAVGFVWLVLNGAFDRSGYIRWIAVDAEQRGGGIGQRLLALAEDQVQAVAADMFLLCSDFNTDAHRFYQRHGYSQVGTLPDYVLPGVAELIFRKTLRR